MVLIAMVVCMLVAFAAFSICFCPRTTQMERVGMWIGVASLLAIPLWLAGTIFPRKWKTGHFLVPPGERLALLANAALREASPRWKRGMVILWSSVLVFWIAFAALWIRAGIHNPAKRDMAILWLVTAAFNLINPVMQLRKQLRKPCDSPETIAPPSTPPLRES
jgi:hypothetical protein